MGYRRDIIRLEERMVVRAPAKVARRIVGVAEMKAPAGIEKLAFAWAQVGGQGLGVIERRLGFSGGARRARRYPDGIRICRPATEKAGAGRQCRARRGRQPALQHASPRPLTHMQTLLSAL